MATTAPPSSGAVLPDLKPKGHSAFAEHLVQPAVVIGSTALTTIAGYVLAQDNLTAILAGHGQGKDWLILIITIALGVLVDTAIIIAGSRYVMHAQRPTKQDKMWRNIALTMFALCLFVEASTLFYFFYLIQPESVPVDIRGIVQSVHDILYFFRAGLPPLIIAFFVVAVRPLTYERSDRKEQMKSDTSVRLMGLESQLAKPGHIDNKDELLRQYQTQLRLNQYASGSTDAEKKEDDWLIQAFRDIWKEETTPTDETVWVTHTALQDLLARLSAETQTAITQAVQGIEARLTALMADLKPAGNGPPVAKWSRTKAEQLEKDILGHKDADDADAVVTDGVGV